LAAAVLAFLLRLIGIGWGLPNSLHNQTYHPDEYLLMQYALRLDLGHGVWDPHFYNYGSLWLYIMSITVRVAQGWGLVASPAGYHLACRLVAAGLGSATVALVFLIGRRLSGLAGGVAAAAVLLVAPAHVVHSRFHTVDVPAAFFVTAAVLLAVKAYQDEDTRRSMKFALWGGVLAGLAAAVKYNMALAVLPVVLAVVLRGDPSRRKGWVVGGAVVCAAAAFLVTTPGFLFDNAAFMRDFTFELRHAREGHGLVFAATPPGWIYHIGNLVEGLGAIAPIVALIGIVLAIRARNRAAWLLLAFVVPHYFVIASAEVKFLRYTLPLAPMLCVFAGSALAAGTRKTLLESRWAVGAGALLVLGATTGNNAAVLTELMVGGDPRDQAAEWLAHNAHGSSIGFPTVPWFYTPPIFPDTVEGLGRDGALFRLNELRQVTDYRPMFYWPEGAADPPSWDPGLVTVLNPEYVVASSFEFDDYERLVKAPLHYETCRFDLDRYEATRRLLAERYQVVQAFGYPHPMAHDMMYISPRIVIWKRTAR
jgi:hypothetical protein